MTEVTTYRFLDVLDVVLVTGILVMIYRSLKGTSAFYLFIGFVLLYFIGLAVSALDMRFSATLFDQFFRIGLVSVVIIFQPEIRKFLLSLGNSTMKSQWMFLQRIFRPRWILKKQKLLVIRNIQAAILSLQQQKRGALILFIPENEVDSFSDSGILVDSLINPLLLESIFSKKSALHDGAVIIQGGRLKAARCILPISETADLPGHTGLRHRAAVGGTENNNFVAIVVSEQSGEISVARHGFLRKVEDAARLEEILKEIFTLN